MRKLLRANFARLWKDRMFWLCIGVMAAIAICVCANFYYEINVAEYKLTVTLDDALFTWSVLIGGFAAAFCSLFLGVEYSDGTIRNKLMVGHRRAAIYLANLVTCLAACLLMAACYMVCFSAIGIPLFGLPAAGLAVLAKVLLGCVMVTAVFAALFTAVAMACQNKAAVAVICLIAYFALLFVSMFIQGRLEEPEMWDSYYYLSENGELVRGEAEPNPHYVSGFKREVCEFLDELLPVGQALQLVNLQPEHPVRQLGYSALLVLLSTFAGLAVFRKKDLK